MLDFYLTEEGRVPDNQDALQFVGGLTLDDCQWLAKFGFVEDGVFSFFDDSWLPPADVQAALKVLIQRQDESRQTPGFSSPAVERLRKILTSAVDRNSGLATYCD
jgi:hypothetical protein